MNNTINIDEDITNRDFVTEGFDSNEYENTHFVSCNFTQLQVSGIDFVDCIFEDCNLALTVVNNVGFKNVQFVNCKLIGVDFSVCNSFLLQMSFIGSNLKMANFEKIKLTNTLFDNCDLTEAYFVETNLEKSVFNNCNLHQAIFSFTNLKHANLSTSYGYIINPNENKIQKAKFSLGGLSGLLTGYDIKIV